MTTEVETTSVIIISVVYPLKNPSNACLSYLDNGFGCLTSKHVCVFTYKTSKYLSNIKAFFECHCLKLLTGNYLYSTKSIIYSQQKHEITGKLIASYTCEKYEIASQCMGKES